jgi:Domain of unknown function (DUF397)
MLMRPHLWGCYGDDRGAHMESGRINWRKSSFCHVSGDCLEVAAVDGTVLMRRTTSDGAIDGDILRLTSAEWNAFIKAVIGREFEDLT